MSIDVDKLLELAQQIFPKPPQGLPKIYLKGWSQPGYPQAPDDEATLPENSMVIQLVPLKEPERPAVVGQRTNGEGERFY